MFTLYTDPNTKENYGYSCNSCTDGARQYQTDKIIRNMVRTKSSLYTMNLATCNVYNNENSVGNVNWNQMSDRNNAHVQTKVVPSRASSTKHTITRNRPGASSPGGAGVDVKHGSYERHLARLKGKSCSKNMVASCNTSANYDTVSTYVEFEFLVGDYCWALADDGLGPFYKAQIMTINLITDLYTIQFLNNGGMPNGVNYSRSKDQLLIYLCGC
jgi:hypothetical protein